MRNCQSEKNEVSNRIESGWGGERCCTEFARAGVESEGGVL